MTSAPAETKQLLIPYSRRLQLMKRAEAPTACGVYVCQHRFMLRLICDIRIVLAASLLTFALGLRLSLLKPARSKRNPLNLLAAHPR